MEFFLRQWDGTLQACPILNGRATRANSHGPYGMGHAYGQKKRRCASSGVFPNRQQPVAAVGY
jgi:hypothetical protein